MNSILFYVAHPFSDGDTTKRDTWTKAQTNMGHCGIELMQFVYLCDKV